MFQLKAKQLSEINPNSFNEVLEPRDNRVEQNLEHPHKLRHNKMVHAQIARLARSQDQLDEFQQNLQTQILDVQRRLDRVEEPNWNLVSARVDFLDIQYNELRDEIKNATVKISDFDKVHASMLELREDVESIENKADKTIPEFRKEISKLDVSFAQVKIRSIIFSYYFLFGHIFLSFFYNFALNLFFLLYFIVAHRSIFVHKRRSGEFATVSESDCCKRQQHH